MITHHIRAEIRELFLACKKQNRLVLERIMNDAEREFEISVEPIRAEAERSTIETLVQLIPDGVPPPLLLPKTRRQRISYWLFR